MATKDKKIQAAIKSAKSKNEVYQILEHFRLPASEERKIVNAWQNVQEMLIRHEQGAYYTPSTQAVA